MAVAVVAAEGRTAVVGVGCGGGPLGYGRRGGWLGSWREGARKNVNREVVVVRSKNGGR